MHGLRARPRAHRGGDRGRAGRVLHAAPTDDTKKRKNDKRDPRQLAIWAATPGTLTDACVPTPEEEGLRDLPDAPGDPEPRRRDAYLRVDGLLCRNNVMRDEPARGGRPRKRRGREFWKWLRSVELPTDAAQASPGAAIRAAESAESHPVGRITRSGSGIVRKLLVECAWSPARAKTSLPGKRPAGVPDHVWERAAALSKRLVEHRRPVLDNKVAKNKANVASAAEISRLVLFLGKESIAPGREAKEAAAATEATA